MHHPDPCHYHVCAPVPDLTPVPEPSMWLPCSVLLVAFLLLAWKKKRKGGE